MFLDNFKVLAMHPSQYGETEVLEIKIVPGAIPYKSRVRSFILDQKDNLHDQINEWLEQVVYKPSVSPWASPLIPVEKNDGRTRWVTDLRVPVYTNAFWISQSLKFVQQDAGCSHEGGGQRLLDIIPG